MRDAGINAATPYSAVRSSHDKTFRVPCMKFTAPALQRAPLVCFERLGRPAQFIRRTFGILTAWCGTMRSRRSSSVYRGEAVRTEVNPVTRQDARATIRRLIWSMRPCGSCSVRRSNSMDRWWRPNRLRFDFAHFRPLSSRDIEEIE
jgi:hypothetical protein